MDQLFSILTDAFKGEIDSVDSLMRKIENAGIVPKPEVRFIMCFNFVPCRYQRERLSDKYKNRGCVVSNDNIIKCLTWRLNFSLINLKTKIKMQINLLKLYWFFISTLCEIYNNQLASICCATSSRCMNDREGEELITTSSGCLGERGPAEFRVEQWNTTSYSWPPLVKNAIFTCL